MAAPILPQDVTEHLEAAIQLSNERIYSRFIEEAETLLALNFPAAAVLVAGVILESILAGQRDRGSPEDRQRIKRWSELRNNVAHADKTSVSLDQATEMIRDVRRFMRKSGVGPSLILKSRLAGASRQVRGKYKFVPTSSVEFMRRKIEELRAEHGEFGN